MSQSTCSGTRGHLVVCICLGLRSLMFILMNEFTTKNLQMLQSCPFSELPPPQSLQLSLLQTQGKWGMVVKSCTEMGDPYRTGRV